MKERAITSVDLIHELEIVLRHIRSIESPATLFNRIGCRRKKVLNKWCHASVLRSAEQGLRLIKTFRGVAEKTKVDAIRSSGQKRPSGGKGQRG